MPFFVLSRFRLAFAALLLGLLLAGCSLAEDVTPPPGSEVVGGPSLPTAVPEQVAFYPVVAPDPAAGAPIYAEKCAPCHGDLGRGDGPRAAQLSVPVKAIGDPALARVAHPADWFRIVTVGNLERFMPGFASLNDRERWDVVAYALTLSRTEEEAAQGAELYSLHCADCHGEQGRGDGPQAEGRPTNFTNQEVVAALSAQDFYQAISNGAGTFMPAFADKLSSEQIWALTAHLRSLSFAANAGETAGPAPTAQAAVSQPGQVSVSLIPPPSGFSTDPEVVLYVVDQMQLTYSTTLSTRIDNTFVFTDVERIEGRVFVATADYGGVTYNSTMHMLQELQEPVNLEIELFDVTHDASQLKIDRLHMFMDFDEPGFVQVIQILVVSNPGDKVVAAPTPGDPVLSIRLPAGASDIQFQDGALGERYLPTPNGFADTSPIAPGSFQIVLAFFLPYQDKLTFSQPLDYPVTSSIILIPEVGVNSSSPVLRDGGVSDMEGQSYRSFTSAALSAGDTLTIELSGAPKAAAAAGGAATTNNDQRTSLLIGIGGLGLALLVAGFWIYRRERLSNAGQDEDDVEEGEPESDAPETETVESLMDAIIALDDLYKSGELPQEAYEQRRAELKARLQTLMA